ncbi:MAG: thiamine phosphate synthase [Deltaproteobacteria bacterium]|nr:thiamine phosphate synthase [Deltaproteobacteria bacterium]
MTHDSPKRAGREALLREVDLYLVTGEEFSAGRSTPAVVDAALEAGVRMIQLREKRMTKRELTKLGEMCRAKTAAAGCLLIVNDHLDVALAIDADGVHLGHSDLPVEAARRIAPDFILGASSHHVDQAVEAERMGASYVNIGPIFPTKTKSSKVALGPRAVADVVAGVSIPVTCMGGIKLDNVDEVLIAGARIVSVVTAVTAATDIRTAVRELRDKILAARENAGQTGRSR